MGPRPGRVSGPGRLGRWPVGGRVAGATGLLLLVAWFGASASAPRTVALGIAPVPDTLTIVHDRTAVVPPPGVLANDVGLGGGTTATLVTPPTHGTVSLKSDGGYTYDPDPGYVGTDRFWYRPSGLITSSTSVTITITNRAPVAVADTYVATSGKKLTVAAPGVLGNDLDADGDALSAILVDGGGNGSLSLASDGGFVFTSGGSFVGPRTFTYQASDGIASSPVVTVTIDVRPAATPTPAPTPTPVATSTPRPTATPIASILPIPLPSILPKPTATARPTPTPTTRPSASPTPRPTATAPDPTSGGPTPDPTPGAGGGAGGPTATDPSAPPSGAPGGHSSGARRFDVDQTGSAQLGGFGDLDLVGAGALIDWAVPALVLTVPGLLVILAVLAQAIGAVLWLPIARRWLGAFGLRSNQRSPERAARA